MDVSLVLFDRARRALAEARSVDEVRDVRDQAAAIAAYLRQQGQSLEMQNDVAEIKLRAERKLGEMLMAMEKQSGIRTDLAPRNTVLQGLGIERIQSHRWQREAAVPDEVFESFVAETKRQGELTSAGLLRLAADLERDARKVDAPPMPVGVYDVILADPPWQYDNTGLPGSAESQYPTMSMAELRNVAVPVGDNAALFLWVTNPFLREGVELADAWGFSYKTNIVWVKTALKSPGMGFYVRGQHELLFICTKGSFVPDQRGKSPIGSVLVADIQEHSRKPDAAYDLIENMYPGGRYLELFARRRREGWTSWGNHSDFVVA